MAKKSRYACYVKMLLGSSAREKRTPAKESVLGKLKSRKKKKHEDIY